MGERRRPNPPLSGCFSAEPNDFHLGFPHSGSSHFKANQMGKLKRMRLFAFIKPDVFAI